MGGRVKIDEEGERRERIWSVGELIFRCVDYVCRDGFGS